MLLSRIVPGHQLQSHLFDHVDKMKMMRVQKAVDHINAVTTRNKVQYACEGLEKKWTTRRDMLSKKFTTSFEQLIVAHL